MTTTYLASRIFGPLFLSFPETEVDPKVLEDNQYQQTCPRQPSDAAGVPSTPLAKIPHAVVYIRQESEPLKSLGYHRPCVSYRMRFLSFFWTVTDIIHWFLFECASDALLNY